ncbi:MAG: hypothetical protein JO316_25630 [Abitibacteriaceae bacterium]|nr:hypothetical protein [Abditibacteriaceae bacterium]MBV9868753.1 hypothetical protein [Abditibacteriaceae bacterium]
MEVDKAVEKLLDDARSYAHRQGHQLMPFKSDGHEPEGYLSGCNKCGMRVEVRPQTRLLIQGDATVQACAGKRPELVAQTRAWIVGESYTELEKLLDESYYQLSAELQERFYFGEYQLEQKRFVSENGFLALQWKLRAQPTEPISEENPQPIKGVVELVTLLSDDVLMPAIYRGAIQNPNESEDEGEWEMVPLLPDERGFGYRDDLGQWRFKREDGYLGFYVLKKDLEFLNTAKTQSRKTPNHKVPASKVPAPNEPVPEAPLPETPSKETPLQEPPAKKRTKPKVASKGVPKQPPVPPEPPVPDQPLMPDEPSRPAAVHEPDPVGVN